MPTIFEYFGLFFSFYSNEHDPIHLHVEYGEYTDVVELVIENGKLVAVNWRDEGNNPLPPKEKKTAERFVRKMYKEVALIWFDYFVMGKRIKKKRITIKIH